MKQRNPSVTNKIKDDIQKYVREIVILRDGGCILRKIRGCTDDVFQADHLITRANSATYADTRLIVCLCRTCHGWKHWHKEQYDALVRSILPPERLKLWDACLATSWKPVKVNWQIELANLKTELLQLPGIPGLVEKSQDSR